MAIPESDSMTSRSFGLSMSRASQPQIALVANGGGLRTSASTTPISASTRFRRTVATASPTSGNSPITNQL